LGEMKEDFGKVIIIGWVSLRTIGLQKNRGVGFFSALRPEFGAKRRALPLFYMGYTGKKQMGLGISLYLDAVFVCLRWGLKNFGTIQVMY
jgi:hypothetical protein